MIPTKNKDKLPSFRSYPIGAQAVSDALSGVPCIDDLELWFSANQYGESEVDGEHLVIAARYHVTDVAMSACKVLEESGFYSPTWDVHVYAVPRTLSAPIRTALVDHGLAHIRDWLSRPRTDVWLSTTHECRVWYCPTTDRLIVKSGQR